MCEQFVARASEPFRLDELWALAEKLERFGLAGFGWGAAWTDGAGRLGTHRDVRAFRDDPGRDALGATETTSLLVHLRRPSRLSTLQLPDTQPFADPAGRFAFSHNGDLRDYRAARARYRRDGRIHGRADSEVGQRWLEDAWSDEEPVGHLLGALHDAFGGEANLAVTPKLTLLQPGRAPAEPGDPVPLQAFGVRPQLVKPERLGRAGDELLAHCADHRSRYGGWRGRIRPSNERSRRSPPALRRTLARPGRCCRTQVPRRRCAQDRPHRSKLPDTASPEMPPMA